MSELNFNFREEDAGSDRDKTYSTAQSNSQRISQNELKSANTNEVKSNPDMLWLLQENKKKIDDLVSQSEVILGKNKLRLLNMKIIQNA